MAKDEALTYDPTNTDTWQSDGTVVFLLEEIPGRWDGKGSNRRPSTQNRFTINVRGNRNTSTLDEVQIALAVRDHLNSLNLKP